MISCARARAEALVASEIAMDERASSVSTATPRSLIAWSAAYSRHTKSGRGTFASFLSISSFTTH